MSDDINLDPKTLTDLVDNFTHWKEVAENTKARFEKARDSLVKYFDAVQEVSATITNGDGKAVKVWVVKPENKKIDDQGLAEALGPDLYGMVSKRVVDKDRLEYALSSGKIELDMILPYIQYVPGTAYIRTKPAQEEDASD